MNLLEEHKKGIKDNYRKIWAVYSFLKWYQVFFSSTKHIKRHKIRSI